MEDFKNIKVFASCHNHSTFSDAEQTPERLVEIAKGLGHGGIILTDHDTVRGTYFVNKAARKAGMMSILGCEFSTHLASDDTGVHLLGFDFNPDNKEMKELLAFGSSVQTDRTKFLFHYGQERGTLREGCTWQDVLDDHPYNDYICNNQVFVSMVKRGIYTPDEYQDVFFMPNFTNGNRELKAKVVAAIGKSYHDIKTHDVVRIIKAAGGVPVVAHPHNQMKYTQEFLDMGVMGFETRFNGVTEEEFHFFENLCAEKNLYNMGGSDHSGVLGGFLHVDPVEYAVPDHLSGIAEECFMKIYERRLG